MSKERRRDGGITIKNLELQGGGHTLIIRVEPTQGFGPSSSGKTTIVPSTEGNVNVPGSDVKVGLNCYKPRSR